MPNEWSRWYYEYKNCGFSEIKQTLATTIYKNIYALMQTNFSARFPNIAKNIRNSQIFKHNQVVS